MPSLELFEAPEDAFEAGIFSSLELSRETPMVSSRQLRTEKFQYK